MQMVERDLEDHAYGDLGRPKLLTPDNRQAFINYLVYLEGMVPVILNGIMKLETIDDLMAWRFFLTLDNPELQEEEIKPFAPYYRGCFKLYALWDVHRRARGLRHPLEGSALDGDGRLARLSEWEGFETYATQQQEPL